VSDHRARTPKSGNRGRAALGLALAGIATLAMPALADASSYGFSIVNGTGASLQLKRVLTTGEAPFELVGGVEQGPNIGDVVEPNGKALDVELRSDREVSATLFFMDPVGNTYSTEVSNHAGDRFGEFATCATSGGPSQCEISESRHTTIRFFDPPNTRRTISGSEAQ
jgi:hypothetical protein